MLCLIRHGETIANQQRWYAGTVEYELTDKGRNQAMSIGSLLASGAVGELPEQGQVLHTSPLERATETAKIIGHYVRGSVIATDSRIMEVDYGRMEGMPITKGLSFMHESQQSAGGKYGVEPLDRVVGRASDFLADHAEYMDPDNDKLAIAVGHGTFWAILCASVSGADIESAKIQANNEVLLLNNAGVQLVSAEQSSY